MADSLDAYCRQLRTARNRSTFREINERVGARGLPLAVPRRSDTHAFVCECCRPDCDEYLELSLDDYAKVREGLDRFAVVADHVAAGERVVERHDGHVIVDLEDAVRVQATAGPAGPRLPLARV